MTHPFWIPVLTVVLPKMISAAVAGNPIILTHRIDRIGNSLLEEWKLVCFNNPSSAINWANHHFPGMRCQPRCTPKQLGSPEPAWYIWSELHDAILASGAFQMDDPAPDNCRFMRMNVVTRFLV